MGYHASELVGKHTPSIIHKQEEVIKRGKELTKKFGTPIAGFDVLIHQAKQDGFESREWTLIRKDGTTLPVQLVVSTIKDIDGNITRYVGIATDITEQKRSEEANKSIAILEAKNKEIEHLTYIASHDLQEPLRTIINFADLLVRTDGNRLSEDGAQLLQYIRQSTSRMSQLITAVLKYSKVGQQSRKESVDCNQLLQDVQDDLRLIIKEKHAEIIVGKLPVLLGHEVELKLLFQNLLSNALKFQRTDVTPIIQVNCKTESHQYHFTVTDNGIGIDPKYFHKLFVIFQRLNNTDEYPGVGIGLAHCKKIVELHGGKIWLESEPGQGTKVHFTIYK